MAATGPTKVLGTISAMQTFVENFPMSILDLLHGPTYTSVFVFLMDVLEACGVSTEEIIERVLEKVFGIETKIEGGVEGIYQAIENMDIDEQSEFIKAMEYAIKGILMALLTSIFSCSAIPMIPARYMDGNKSGLPEEDREIMRAANSSFPIDILDMFGMLDINPLSDGGKMYYSIKGGDTYYHKVEEKKVTTVLKDESYKKFKCDKFVKLFVVFGMGHEDYLQYSDTADDVIQFKLEKPVSKDILIEINYSQAGGGKQTESLTIEAGRQLTTNFYITPKDKAEGGRISPLYEVKIKGEENGGVEIGNSYVFWDETSSKPVIDFWDKQGNETLHTAITWGNANNCEKETVQVLTPITLEDVTYHYEPCGMMTDVPRVNVIPSEPSQSDSEYLVCYEGLDPNTLYRTDDMNAFIWYCANRGNIEPVTEYNKMAWDSRITAAKIGITRDTDKQWNDWINSRDFENGNNNFYNFEIPSLYPILQFEPSPQKRNLKVGISAQKYFNEGISLFNGNKLQLNKTIYEFNWNYLENIKIFRPKVILYGMFDALLNGALSELLSLRPTLQRKEMRTMLSNAIKKYIEADDMEVSDCYFTFSNDEFDSMLEEMLLSRYSATYKGGEETVAQQHDINEYMAMIDGINSSAEKVGQTEAIKKVITEVSASGGKEGSIDYGISLGSDKEWWKRLLWAIAMPIIESIFTPQVILLILINFDIMGITSMEDLFSTNQGAVIKLITNKIIGLIKSIILFIKDKLVEILFEFFMEKIRPILMEFALLLFRERLEAWLKVLQDALDCIPLFKFPKRKYVSAIDDVNYADIVNEQTTPESTNNC